MERLRTGDIVSFHPIPHNNPLNEAVNRGAPIDYLSGSPKILARAIDFQPEDPAHAPEGVAEQIASGEQK